MQFIRNIFWNGDQRRLRALWRLLAQIILLVLISLPIQAGIGFIAFLLRTSQGGVTVSPRFLLESPVVLALSSYGVLAAMLLSVWLAGRFLDRRPLANFGFHLGKDWWIDLGFGLLLGAFLMLLIFLVELIAGWVTVTGTLVTTNPDIPFFPAILGPLFVFVAVGIYEETFSRGYQLHNMAEGFNWKAIGPRWALTIATLLSSAVFGLLHLSNPNSSFISTFNIFAAGALLLSMGVLLTGELAIPIGVHITWNFFQGNVFGFPVSGGDFTFATFISIQQGGPDLWTGGVFGPEAGLLGLAAIVLGSALTVLWVSRRYGRAKLRAELAEHA
jgi:membrane protease YdiL (CAAX protease family)